MTTERTIVVPKKALQWGLLAALSIIAVLLGAPLLASSPEEAGTKPAASAAAVVSAGTLGPSTTELVQEHVDMDAALEAAGHTFREIMWFDHTEGREAWALRIDSICTPNGMAFWSSELFADQVWPVMMERQFVTQDIEMLGVRIVGEGALSGSIIVEVTAIVTYTTAESVQPQRTESTNKIVMVYTEDDQWLNDGPPSPSIRDS